MAAAEAAAAAIAATTAVVAEEEAVAAVGEVEEGGIKALRRREGESSRFRYRGVCLSVFLSVGLSIGDVY